MAEENVRKFSGEEFIILGGAEARVPEVDRTVVAILQYEENGNIFQPIDASGVSRDFGPSLDVNLTFFAGFNEFREAAPAAKLTKEEHWLLVAATHVKGNNKPRLHIFDFTTKVWFHQDADAVMTESTFSTMVNFKIGGKDVGVGPFKGLISAIALFNNIAMSDAQIEALAAAPSIASWASTYPAATSLWMLNQKEVGEEVKDSALRGANQIKREGTSVVKKTLPIPYGVVTIKTVQIHQGVVKKVRRWVMRATGLVNG